MYDFYLNGILILKRWMASNGEICQDQLLAKHSPDTYRRKEWKEEENLDELVLFLGLFDGFFQLLFILLLIGHRRAAKFWRTSDTWPRTNILIHHEIVEYFHPTRRKKKMIIRGWVNFTVSRLNWFLSDFIRELRQAGQFLALLLHYPYGRTRIS